MTKDARLPVTHKFKSSDGLQDISNRIAEIQSTQEDFKVLHQSVTAAKANMPSQDELRKGIQRKENERASLNTRIVKARDKAQA